MDILGSIGKLYTFILLVLLFLGSGLAVWAGINAIINKKEKIKENKDKIMSNVSSSYNSIKNKNILGGVNMKNNGFIKLAVFSLVGIVISAAILTALPSLTGNSMSNMNMASQYNAGSMNMQSGYSQTGMQGMNNQMSMQGSTGYGMQGVYNTNPDLYTIQQQLNAMQQQINQLQNQMSNSSMNSMQSNTGNSMNNNNNMNNSSMNTNNMNSNSNSSGSMSGMPMM